MRLVSKDAAWIKGQVCQVSALYRQRVRSYREKTLWGGGTRPPPLGRRGLIQYELARSLRSLARNQRAISPVKRLLGRPTERAKGWALHVRNCGGYGDPQLLLYSDPE